MAGPNGNTELGFAKDKSTPIGLDDDAAQEDTGTPVASDEQSAGDAAPDTSDSDD